MKNSSKKTKVKTKAKTKVADDTQTKAKVSYTTDSFGITISTQEEIIFVGWDNVNAVGYTHIEKAIMLYTKSGDVFNLPTKKLSKFDKIVDVYKAWMLDKDLKQHEE